MAEESHRSCSNGLRETRHKDLAVASPAAPRRGKGTIARLAGLGERYTGTMLHRHRSPLPEWAIPAAYALAALVAAVALPRLENRYLPTFVSPVSASVALSLYSSITSGMLALTGIVFSLAFVMVQFSAVAYSPRLVLWISRDPVMWNSIGVFTATFLYSIGAMLWVDRGGSGKVPFLSGLVAVLLLLGSVAMFLALIQRIGLLQINRMLSFTGNLGRKVVEQMYPSIEQPEQEVSPAELAGLPITQTVLYTGEPLALQAIDEQLLAGLSMRSGGSVEVASAVGDTLIAGTPLLRVFGGETLLDDTTWRSAFETGEDRTFEQDPKYALRLLVDIAIKALSPAINDPTTAVQALDQIQDLLFRLGSRRLEIGTVRDSGGNIRLVIPHPSWEDFLRLAFDEIRACGATSVQVMRRMRALVSDLIAALPNERHAALEHHRERLNVTTARSFADDEDKLEASVEDKQGLGMPRKSERAHSVAEK